MKRYRVEWNANYNIDRPAEIICECDNLEEARKIMNKEFAKLGDPEEEWIQVVDNKNNKVVLDK